MDEKNGGKDTMREAEGKRLSEENGKIGKTKKSNIQDRTKDV